MSFDIKGVSKYVCPSETEGWWDIYEIEWGEGGWVLVASQNFDPQAGTNTTMSQRP